MGRFRRFVEQYDGTPPASGVGAHPLIPGSGWDSSWDALLPASQADLIATLSCHASNTTCTDAPGGNETYPVNCFDWYVAFAFCAWDGSRLPTEAEWEYVANGGSEDRTYPWGDDALTTARANYYDSDQSPLIPVGSHSPLGGGRWGHIDLAGSVWEWNLDWHGSWVSPCDNCANLTPSSGRVNRGGGYDMAANGMQSDFRRVNPSPDTSRDAGLGVRRARSAP